MVVGGQAGIVQLFDMNSRSILRKFEMHTHASCPPTDTKSDPEGSHATSSTGDPWSSVIVADVDPSLLSHRRTV